MLTSLIASVAAATPITTARVEVVTATCGVRAYLIHEPTVPFLSLALHIQGGGVTDPWGKEGLAYMTAGLLDEGAGPYDSQAFRAELEDNAIRLSFDVNREGFVGDLRTLTLHREHAFELLRLALTEPRFDAEPVERIRSQIQADLRRRSSDPDHLAGRAWHRLAFDGHAYAHSVRGTPESIAAELDTADLPPLDLLIRTSGEVRLSNFLLWQSAYAELIFTDVLWPDFTVAHLEAALADFAGRERRFGGR